MSSQKHIPLTFTSPSTQVQLPTMEKLNQIRPDDVESKFHIEITDELFQEIEKEYYQRHDVDVNECFKQLSLRNKNGKF